MRKKKGETDDANVSTLVELRETVKKNEKIVTLRSLRKSSPAISKHDFIIYYCRLLKSTKL